jgi:hypothetical protein
MLVNKTITTVKIRPLMTVPVNESSGFPIILPLSPELIVKPKGFTPSYFNSKQPDKYTQSKDYLVGSY